MHVTTWGHRRYRFDSLGIAASLIVLKRVY